MTTDAPYPSQTAPSSPSGETAPPSPPPLYAAQDLLAGGDRADIALGDQVYTLRLTRNGKLILTK